MSLRRHKNRIKNLEERVKLLPIIEADPIPDDPRINALSPTSQWKIRKVVEAINDIRNRIDEAKEEGLINTKEEEEAYRKLLSKEYSDLSEKLKLER